LKGIDLADGESVITASAGEDWDFFVAYCVNENLAGVECLSGIPGTVGGTPVQNVGAYGQEVSETTVSVRCFDRENNTIVTLSNEQCGFAYRTSILNTVERDRYVVISTTYSLAKNGRPKIAYKDLIEHFRGHSPTLAETREAVLSIRRSKSMVIDPTDPNRRSVGSFFKNPIVSQSKFDEIALKFDDNVPHFPALPSLVKIPAAWLIEQAGFHKGYLMGSVGLSTNHTLAIVNRGGATAADVLRLRDAIRSAVSSEFGVDLVQEPVLVGNFTAKI
jgi:UDP-N-acetylmuramate dehydrogenase